MKSKDKVAALDSETGAKQPVNIFYRPPANGGNLWELSKESNVDFLTQSPIINLGSGSSGDCSCVMAGTEILMADGTTQAIETFVGGEIVKTMTGTSKVISLDRIRLGVTRRIIEMRVGNRPPLFISDEHAMWTRFEDSEGVYEWWGVYNFNQYLVEKANGYGVCLKRDAVPLRFDIPQTHAHIEGWRHVQPIFHVLHPDTPLFHLIVEEGSSYIAGGFVISSHAADKDSENFNWTGTSENKAASQFIEALIA